MSFSDILWGLLPWTLLAVYCISAAGLLMQLGYGIYRWVFHGKRRLSDIPWLATACLIGYCAVVLGLTNFSRVLGATKSVNLILFFAYFDAFATGSLRAWQLIVFNVLMFLPMGFLVPFISRRLDSLKAALICGLTFSLLVETLQLINSAGIFELDDLFHNTLGSGIGYAIYAWIFGRRLWKKRPDKKRRRLNAAEA